MTIRKPAQRIVFTAPVFASRILPCLLLLAAVACGGTQRPAAESSADAKQQAAPPTLPVLDIPSDPFQLLPAECFAGVRLDVRAYRESALYREKAEQSREGLSPDEDRLLRYLLEQTEAAAMGVARDEKRPGKARPLVAVVLRGDYELVGILALLADLAEGGQVQGIESPDPNREGGAGRFLQFYSDRQRQGLILDEHTIVLASRELMPAVLEIAARPDQASRFANTELCRSIGEYAGLGKSALSLVFSVQAGMADAVKAGSPVPSLFAKYEEAVRNVTGIGASLALTDGLQIDATVVTTGAEYPPRLVELANAVIFALGLIEKDAKLKQLVDSIDIKAEGKLVHLGFHATEQQLFDALDKIEQKLQESGEEQGQAPGTEEQPKEKAAKPPGTKKK